MDDHSRQRSSQNAPPMQAPNSRYTIQDPSQQQRTTDRYRPPPIATAPGPTRSMGTGTYSGYYQEPATAFSGTIPQSAISYGTEYGAERQTQSFGGYNPAMMYNVPQTSSQGAVYDTTQQFQTRQPTTALGMLNTAVSGPYFSSETPGTATAATSALHPQARASTSSAPVYSQTQVPNYSATISNVGAIPQASETQDVPIEGGEFGGSALEEKWIEYQSSLRGVFQNIRNGALEPASETLLSISTWLLSQAAALGLNLDDQNLHADRLKLWNDFNHAWLALFQQQKDMMDSSSQPSSRSQGLISREVLEKMGKELVRLCDGIERLGLVDYQYGVWEEQIIAILGECLDVYEAADEDNDTRAGPSSHHAAQ